MLDVPQVCQHLPFSAGGTTHADVLSLSDKPLVSNVDHVICLPGWFSCNLLVLESDRTVCWKSFQHLCLEGTLAGTCVVELIS